MITDEMAARFHLPPIGEYQFPEIDYYHTFLIQSDYVALKAAEAVCLGKPVDDELVEIVAARDYARQMINALEEAQGSGQDGTSHT